MSTIKENNVFYNNDSIGSFIQFSMSFLDDKKWDSCLIFQISMLNEISMYLVTDNKSFGAAELELYKDNLFYPAFMAFLGEDKSITFEGNKKLRINCKTIFITNKDNFIKILFTDLTKEENNKNGNFVISEEILFSRFALLFDRLSEDFPNTLNDKPPVLSKQ